jgi:hypothetical protein
MIFLAFSSDRFNIFYIEAAFGLESIVLYLFVKQINEKKSYDPISILNLDIEKQKYH